MRPKSEITPLSETTSIPIHFICGVPPRVVHIDSQSSEELVVTSGVLQGSILGPHLFIVYINDLLRCVKHCFVNMYVDDTVLYLVGPTVHSLIFYSNQDLQCVSEWLEDNNLVLNVSKTKCVLFTSQRHKERDCILNLKSFKPL